mgnify:CR=1 FL=1
MFAGKSNKFIVYSSEYDENSGGSIALHRLCDLINRAGHECYLQPMDWVSFQNGIFRKTKQLCRTLLNKITKHKFKTNPEFITPIAKTEDLDDAIAIYPEIIKNNPLKSKKVVRWLLYKIPTNDAILDNTKDLFFYYQEAFNINLNNKNINIGGQLQTIYVLDEIYKNNNNKRMGSCYTIRKGKGKNIIHDRNKSILIDNLDHKNISKIFNKSEFFISYDSYTMYSNYAAMCGCISIVVPEPGVDKNQWQPTENLRLGVAYGFDEIEWAKRTANKVGEYLKKQETEKNKSVIKFIETCNEYFSSN